MISPTFLVLLVNFFCFLDGHGRFQRSHMAHVKLFRNKESRGDICLDGNVRCVPFVQCPAHVKIGGERCRLAGGRFGICCTTGQNHTGVSEGKERFSQGTKLDPTTLKLITHSSKAELAAIRTRESNLLVNEGRHAILYPDKAGFGHFMNSRLLNLEDLGKVLGVATGALQITIATKEVMNNRKDPEISMEQYQENLRPTILGDACKPSPFCPQVSQRFRRIDGSCNNIRHPTWGTSLSPYSRLLPPSYADGVWAPRVSVYGQPLPSARLVSTTIIQDGDVQSNEHTLLVMQFGQFLAHETTQSIDTPFPNGSAVACCTGNGAEKLPPELQHHSCLPIQVPEDDIFYRTFKHKCMNFIRSLLAPGHDCTLGYAQQMNKITHFLDGSAIYGSNPKHTGELRSFTDGLLNGFDDLGRELLPLSKSSDPFACLTRADGSACFDSGDTRTNQMLTLVALHTIFFREHNRVARELKQINPHWEDERLFLEARRIVTAELQVIIYKEFVPIIIGEAAMDEFQLNLQDGPAYSSDYDENIDPSITNEFSTAAFRFGHSIVDGHLRLYDINSIDEIIALPEIMFYPSRMRKREVLDELMNCLTTEPMQEVDNIISKAMTKYMFKGGFPFGVDIAALNIQRGRDHGLRPYNDYRELVGLPRIRNFEEFGLEMGYRLKAVYASVDDIDLWIGGLLEQKFPGSIVGPTFRDIIADQFARLKKGDRYFFDLDPEVNPAYFTPGQLIELRRTRMYRIICENSDKILLSKQAPNPFKKPGIPGNEFQDCSSDAIPRLNLLAWKEVV